MTESTKHGTQVDKRNRGILLLAAGQTLVWASLLYVFPALLPRWEVSFEWSKQNLTGAITIALLIAAVCSPWIGRRIDTGYGPVILAGGALLGGICLWCIGAVQQLWQFYLLWALIGVALSACLYEPCFMLITRAYGKDAKRSIILVTLIAGFASSISFPAAHWIAEREGWHAVVRCFSLVVIFAGAPLLYFGGVITERNVPAANSVTRNRLPSLTLLKNTTLLRLGLGFAALAIVHGATLHHLLPLLADRGLAAGLAVLVASLIGPMQVCGRLFITALQQRLSHALMAQAVFVLIGLSLILLFFASYGMALAVLFAVAFGCSYGVVSIIRPIIARDLLGDAEFGAKSGLLAFFYLIGAAFAPYLGSLIWSAGGYDLMILVLLLVAAGGFFTIRAVTATAAEPREAA